MCRSHFFTSVWAFGSLSPALANSGTPTVWLLWAQSLKRSLRLGRAIGQSRAAAVASAFSSRRTLRHAILRMKLFMIRCCAKLGTLRCMYLESRRRKMFISNYSSDLRVTNNLDVQ